MRRLLKISIFSFFSSVVSLVIGLVIMISPGLAIEKIKTPAGYGSRPVEMIIRWGAGGGSDRWTRTLSRIAEKFSDVKTVPINITGANGMNADTEILNRPADGYALITIENDFVMNFALKATKHTLEEFAYIARFNYDFEGIYIRPDETRFKDFTSLVKYAKDNPGKLSAPIASPGAICDAVYWELEEAFGFQFKHVPLGSAGQRIAATLGKHVDFMYEEPGDVWPQLEAGQLKPILVLTDTRVDHPLFKGVPTTKELGHSVTIGCWRGFAAKKGTPKEILEYWEKVFLEVMKTPEFKEFEMKNLAHFRKGPLESKEFTEFVYKDLKGFEETYKRMGLVK